MGGTAGINEEQEQALRLFTDQFVDLDVFTQNFTDYRLRDVDGRPLLYRVPADLPWPVALTFLRAMDRYEAAQVDLAKASRKTQEARLAKSEAEWAHLLEALAAILRLHECRDCAQPHDNAAAAPEHLGSRMGAGFMLNWLDVVRTRLHMARAGSDTWVILQRILRGEKVASEGKASSPSP